MAASVIPAPGSEAPVVAGAPAAVPAAVPAPAAAPLPGERKPLIPPSKPVNAIAEAADRARKALADGKLLTGNELLPPMPGDVPVAKPGEAAAPKPAEAPVAAPAGDAPAEELVVDLPGRRPEDPPFTIEAGDKEAAERLRDLVNGYTRGEQARTIREQAAADRAEAEDLRYSVELDPAGFIGQVMTKPADQDYLFRFLATRPGVLERSNEWIAELLADPDALGTQARLVDSDGIKRQQAITQDVSEKRAVSANARKIVGTASKTMDSLVPDNWGDDAREQFMQDILGDVRAFARANNLLTVDPRRVPGFIQHRLKLLG